MIDDGFECSITSIDLRDANYIDSAIKLIESKAFQILEKHGYPKNYKEIRHDSSQKFIDWYRINHPNGGKINKKIPDEISQELSQLFITNPYDELGKAIEVIERCESIKSIIRENHTLLEQDLKRLIVSFKAMLNPIEYYDEKVEILCTQNFSEEKIIESYLDLVEFYEHEADKRVKGIEKRFSENKDIAYPNKSEEIYFLTQILHEAHEIKTNIENKCYLILGLHLSRITYFGAQVKIIYPEYINHFNESSKIDRYKRKEIFWAAKFLLDGDYDINNTNQLTLEIIKMLKFEEKEPKDHNNNRKKVNTFLKNMGFTTTYIQSQNNSR